MRCALAVVVAFVVLAGVGPVSRAEVAVGFANPLSGPYAASGARNLLAAMTAVEAVNAAGGVLGEPLELVVADDKCGVQEAIDSAEKLVRDGVVMVVGHLCSHSSLLAAAVYDMAGIVMISPDSTHPRLTEEDRPNVFRLIGRDDEQGPAAARLIRAHWPDRRVAIAHDGSTYGHGLALQARRAMQRRDIRLVLFERYEASAASFGALVDRLHETAAGLLYIGGYGPEAGRIAVEAAAAGIDLQLVGGDGLAMDEFWAVAGSAGEGTVFSAFATPLNSPRLRDGVATDPAILEQFAEGGLGAYAAVELWTEATARAGTTDAKPVIHVLERGRFQTARGTIDFDAKGDLEDAAWAWFVWRNGRTVPLD
jgi:branched-chain amino acid transport system substrate-binding protein